MKINRRIISSLVLSGVLSCTALSALAIGDVGVDSQGEVVVEEENSTEESVDYRPILIENRIEYIDLDKFDELDINAEFNNEENILNLINNENEYSFVSMKKYWMSFHMNINM